MEEELEWLNMVARHLPLLSRLRILLSSTVTDTSLFQDKMFFKNLYPRDSSFLTNSNIIDYRECINAWAEYIKDEIEELVMKSGGEKQQELFARAL